MLLLLKEPNYAKNVREKAHAGRHAHTTAKLTNVYYEPIDVYLT
jgi:hypothetical protein